MRFHELTVSAFGPFAGTETVDFDALSADGLFLLRGSTGAGKTSVLDAITFALYGDVPGERAADRLKSQHAPAERVPYVELDFSCGEQRYWVRRQPTYYRPAKRAGANPQREGTALVIKRFDQGEWKPVPAARVQEGDLELQQIIGLKMHEFTKVILLPQGAFAKLLHASNEERRSILEQLFDIGTYERLEAHLWDQMRQAEAELKDIDSRLQAHASGVRSAAESLLGAQPKGVLGEPSREQPGDGPREQSGEPGPEHPAEQPLDRAVPLEEVEVEDLTGVVTQRAEAQQQILTEAEQSARTAAEQAAEQAESLSQARAQLNRWAEHLRRRENLETQRGAAEKARGRVAEHAAAAGLRDWLTAAEQAEEAHRKARQHAGQTATAADRALEAQEDVPAAALTTEDGADSEALAAALTQLVQLQARLTDPEAAEAEARHTGLAAAIRAAEDSADQAQQQREALASQLQAEQQRLQEQRHQLTDPEELQAQRDRAHRSLETARRRTELVAQRDSIHVRQLSWQDKGAERKQSLEAAQTTYRQTAEAYLRWQAHELAETLEPGQPCLVCGSLEHPNPLTSTEETVTRQAVDAAAESLQDARAEVEQARAEHSAAAEAAQQVRQNLAEHRDVTAQEAEALRAAAEDQLAAAESAQAQQRRLVQSIEKLSSTAAETSQQHSTAEHRAEQQRSEAARLTAEAKTLEERITGLRAGYESIDARRGALDELQAVLEAAQRAAQQAETAASQARRSRAAAQEQLEKSVFSSADELEAALCTETELAALKQRVAQFDDDAQQLKFDAELQEVRAGARRAEAGEPTPDEETVTAAQAAAAQAQKDHEHQQRALTAFTARFQSLSETTAALEQALAHRAEQTQELTRRAELARTLNGQGENALRMRLTTFVLAARLERIAEAATHHLAAMTGGRYHLLLDAERAGRGLRGLDLNVHDEYSEQQRPAESLSGGETFMTSLAMALGLAEVVQAEAGGIGMESLFIDEGFGSLDDHTLEAVMSALHTLQGEGRRIGVVSHVSEMHQQIPVQLRVEKTRSGSTLHMELPV